MMNYWLTELLYLGSIVATGHSFTATSSLGRTTLPVANKPSVFFAPTPKHQQGLRQQKTRLSYQTNIDPELQNIAWVDFPDDSWQLADARVDFDKDLLHSPSSRNNRWTTTNNDKIEETNTKTTSLHDLDISFGLPVVVQPKNIEKSTVEYLSMFLKDNKEWIDGMLLRYGAVFFRGFDIETAQDVEDSIRSYNPDLNNQYRGTSPRNTQGGTKYVFSAAEVPSHWPIAQHIEMSFLPAPPKQLYFSALKAPKAIGGETALADFRKVYQDLPQRLREKLATKKLRYTRTHHRVGAKNKSTHDVAAMLGWPEMFGTSDKEEVERLAAKEGMPMRWEGKHSDTFVSEFESEPFQLHPESNVPVFFNHANVFHWTSFPAELFAAFRRTRDWRFLLHAVKVTARLVVQYGLLRKKMALHVAFGDGSPISIVEMHQIRRAIHKNMVFNRWKKGDLMLIDNFSTSHGRQPTYDKGRNIVVAWSDPILKANKPVNNPTLTRTR